VQITRELKKERPPHQVHDVALTLSISTMKQLKTAVFHCKAKPQTTMVMLLLLVVVSTVDVWSHKLHGVNAVSVSVSVCRCRRQSQCIAVGAGEETNGPILQSLLHLISSRYCCLCVEWSRSPISLFQLSPQQQQQQQWQDESLSWSGCSNNNSSNSKTSRCHGRVVATAATAIQVVVVVVIGRLQ
jgi:hypothetical protein